MINDYARFVDSTTSKTSRETMTLMSRLDKLRGNSWTKGNESGEEMQVARLLTAVVGMMATTQILSQKNKEKWRVCRSSKEKVEKKYFKAS